MEWIILIHVLAGATLFGGQFYVEALMATAARTKDPETIMTVGGKVGPTNGRLFTPAGVIVLITGTWIVIESAYEFEMLFISIGFVLTIVALSIGLFLLKPGQSELGDLVAEHGMTSPEAMAKAKSLGNIGHIQTLLVTIIIIVMVLKPGL
jgi:uncharacterized membrane protein